MCVLAVAVDRHLFGRESFQAAIDFPHHMVRCELFLRHLNILSSPPISPWPCIIVYYRYASIECEKSERIIPRVKPVSDSRRG